MTERTCRCEATIPAEVLDGFACGTPGCWRTEPVKASFDAFVAELVRARGETVSPALDHRPSERS